MNSPNCIRHLVVSKNLPVFIIDISAHEQALRLSKLAIEEEKTNNPQSISSNVKAGYVSSYKSHLYNPNFSPLIDIVLSACAEIGNTAFGSKVEFRVLDCWGMVYNEGDYADTHAHFPSPFAAVIYLEMGEDSAPIIFEENLTVYPKSGNLIIFPGIMHHEVPATKSKRVVVSMNIGY
jgi:hypothetical protein